MLMRCPLANILFSGLFYVLLYCSFLIFHSANFYYYIIIIITFGHEHQALMDEVDFTDHLAMGGIKDSRHIATQMIPVML